MGIKGFVSKPLILRLAENMLVGDDCWEWQGAQNGAGYGQAWDGSRNRAAHRVMYEQLVGPVPIGFELDHLCRNKACCNPKHLEVVTHQENILRSNPRSWN